MEYEAFIAHIAFFSVNLDNKIYLLRKAQIAYLKVDKVSTKVSSKYTNFANIFSPKLVVELLKYTRIHDYATKLMNS